MEIQALRVFPLFYDISEEELEIVREVAVERKFRKNNLIIFEDDVGNNLFIIKRGRVKISHISDEGSEAILAILGPRDFFGELAVIDGYGRSASVTSIDEVELIMFQRTDFLAIIEKIPKIAIALLKELAGRIRKSDTHIRSLSLLDAKGRVAATLIRLAEDIGRSKEGKVIIEEMPLQRDLASIAGTSRETISRVIKKFEEEGHCSISKNALQFDDFDRFKKLYS
ncbi:MAG: Crp/Fnr family transcriptional regulator [Calditrichaeota bacterium]|nr:Crp/Fnr family transcriptional regulator [Calditrichota bacterium]MBT7616252.1 Crp/Fnr family transcriptional regulator [Calditrichota bacterium]